MVSVLGQPLVGKTWFCRVASGEEFVDSYKPCCADCFSFSKTVKGEQKSLSIWDFCAISNEKIKEVCLKESDVFLVFMSRDLKESATYALSKREELLRKGKTVFVILNKTDLPETDFEAAVSPDFFCSCRDPNSVGEVIDKVLSVQKFSKGHCFIF
ncbi:hypothetical protein A9K97_gp390 [Tokyovirus A1]|uniref:hypothetical protein n=1 Tax=Tokyovirus A1 TaxID=1826170 RepID=UPI0007A97103|nr:hypothetical protein A9K97_gp390 [Tokyovirus A1]BAU79961.1 hypothetical protein [Tokyovirus A1]